MADGGSDRGSGYVDRVNSRAGDEDDGQRYRRHILRIAAGVGVTFSGLGCIAYAENTSSLEEHDVHEDIDVERAYTFGECSLGVEGTLVGNGETRHIRVYGLNSDGSVIGTAAVNIETYNDDPYVFRVGIPDQNCGIGNVRGYSIEVDGDR
jgi:hypothetical protein